MQAPSLKNLTTSKFGAPPQQQNEILQNLGHHHVASFNYMVDEGLDATLAQLTCPEFELNGSRIKLAIKEVRLRTPEVSFGQVGVRNNAVFPSECRQRAGTYKGRLSGLVQWSLDGVVQQSFEKDFGEIPIMLKSNRCHLAGKTPKELVELGEHEQEWGGYFLVKGHERLVRMLLMTRRNFPVTIRRSGWKMRGPLFSDSGVLIRCVKNDQSSSNNVLHFVTDGTCKLMISYQKVLYYAPMCLILKALCPYSDLFIYQKLIKGMEHDMHFKDCMQNMLRGLHEEDLHTHEQCKKYLGKMFRVRVTECPQWTTDEEVTDFLFKHSVLIHLDSNEDKFNLLVFMTQKLFSFAYNQCLTEGADCVMMQELLLGGHLYLQVIKDRLQLWLTIFKASFLKLAALSKFNLGPQEVAKAAKMAGTMDRALENFLATGNTRANSNLNLMQDKGLTIVAENINRMRYMSHFRSVHRGTFFQEMRTTEARQLLPDAWGFICPVHTPDGSPCGLLNHLTMNCVVTEVPNGQKLAQVPLILTELGMVPLRIINNLSIEIKNFLIVQLDGKVLGYIQHDSSFKLVKELRKLKIEEKVPKTLEIALVPWKKKGGQFPGLFLFTGPARMMRPLINLDLNKVELVGTFEQVYMDVAVTQEEIYPGVTTHMELSKTGFLSNLAQLIPMPDCNQSPRNMYQCQMGKQTMGTPCHNWDLQSEAKLYRLQTPASPLFRPVHYDEIKLDDFAMGTNAIVAVISYTGYDMEDAMIINKAAEERGLAHGSIYKSEFVELPEPNFYFALDPEKKELTEYIDREGLPILGRLVSSGDPLYCYYNSDESKFVVKKYSGKEDCYIHSVKIFTNNDGRKNGTVACISYRVPRNPSIGDKFASRAGQKGICSQKWPCEDLPFTETGLIPDIVFNPHGFPSRMTIAMMIELMAGKSAALHGLVHDASPFKFNEKDTAINYFGRLLEEAGYNYYGTETMYSGIDGRELNVQIFFGVVHYQRLRHMVSDKWQVRSTGPNDVLTRQPIKGRKRGGGVRFGEMERDALISHGASFLLQDRLLHCSDKTMTYICTSCGTLLGPMTLITRKSDSSHLTESKEVCRICETTEGVTKIQIPYIFKFFVTQLASCNINVRMTCDNF